MDNIYLVYFRYVCRHKWFALAYCIKAKIPWQGIIHDLSKFRISEFFTYAQHFYGNKRNEYVTIAKTTGGYSAEDDRDDKLFNKSWLLHIHRNAHHWEYWTITEDYFRIKALDMPFNLILEMVCDWRAAGRAQGRTQPNELIDWYEAHADRMVFSKKTRETVEWLIYPNKPLGSEPEPIVDVHPGTQVVYTKAPVISKEDPMVTKAGWLPWPPTAENYRNAVAGQVYSAKRRRENGQS